MGGYNLLRDSFYNWKKGAPGLYLAAYHNEYSFGSKFLDLKFLTQSEKSETLWDKGLSKPPCELLRKDFLDFASV